MVDVQGFEGPDFIIKELAIITMKDAMGARTILFDKSVGTCLRTILQDANIIFIKGSQKMEWLESFIGKSMNIINIDDFECPSSSTFYETTKCPHHPNNEKYDCVMESVKIYRRWLLEHSSIVFSKMFFE